MDSHSSSKKKGGAVYSSPSKSALFGRFLLFLNKFSPFIYHVYSNSISGCVYKYSLYQLFAIGRYGLFVSAALRTYTYLGHPLPIIGRWKGWVIRIAPQCTYF